MLGLLLHLPEPTSEHADIGKILMFKLQVAHEHHPDSTTIYLQVQTRAGRTGILQSDRKHSSEHADVGKIFALKLQVAHETHPDDTTIYLQV